MILLGLIMPVSCIAVDVGLIISSALFLFYDSERRCI
jgi:hypothetical protein